LKRERNGVSAAFVFLFYFPLSLVVDPFFSSYFTEPIEWSSLGIKTGMIASSTNRGQLIGAPVQLSLQYFLFLILSFSFFLRYVRGNHHGLEGVSAIKREMR